MGNQLQSHEKGVSQHVSRIDHGQTRSIKEVVTNRRRKRATTRLDINVVLWLQTKRRDEQKTEREREIEMKRERREKERSEKIQRCHANESDAQGCSLALARWRNSASLRHGGAQTRRSARCSWNRRADRRRGRGTEENGPARARQNVKVEPMQPRKSLR